MYGEERYVAGIFMDYRKVLSLFVILKHDCKSLANDFTVKNWLNSQLIPDWADCQALPIFEKIFSQNFFQFPKMKIIEKLIKFVKR